MEVIVSEKNITSSVATTNCIFFSLWILSHIYSNTIGGLICTKLFLFAYFMLYQF